MKMEIMACQKEQRSGVEWLHKLPKMTGIQAVGSAPIAQAIKNGSDTIVPVDRTGFLKKE